MFADIEGLGEICDGEKCKIKVVKSTTEDDEAEPKKPEEEEINVLITFTKAVGKIKFHQKFEQTVTSLLEHASKPLALHILGDPESQEIAKKIIEDKAKPKSTYRVGSDVY